MNRLRKAWLRWIETIKLNLHTSAKKLYVPSNCSSAGTATGGGLPLTSPCPPNTVKTVLVLVGGKTLARKRGRKARE